MNPIQEKRIEKKESMIVDGNKCYYFTWLPLAGQQNTGSGHILKKKFLRTFLVDNKPEDRVYLYGIPA